jgi:4-amino-4-deoxy-L-arabinose transferase-like glycosyltransferase
MVYWAGVVSSRLLGGVSEFSLRLSSALASITLALLTSFAASRWFDQRTGLWTGVVLLTFPQFAYEAICYRPDVLFSLFIGAGLLLYASAFGERVRWGPRIAGFAVLGLAILTKGPLGLLLPGLVITLWHLARREWRRLLELVPLTLVALAVALPWYMAVAQSLGTENLLGELRGQNFERFTGAAEGQRDRGHIQPFSYYLLRIWVDLFPWSLLLPSTVWWLVRSGRWRDPRVQLAFWWLGSFLVFLSLAATKRTVYLLPAYPAAALLLGPWLAKVARPAAEGPQPRARHARQVGAVFAIAMAVIGLLALVGATRTDYLVARFDLNKVEAGVAFALHRPLLAISALALVSASWLAVSWHRGETRRLLRGVVTTFVALWLLAITVLPAPFNTAKSYAAAGAWISDRLARQQPFGLTNGPWGHGWRKMGGFGYYSGQPLELLESRQEVDRFLRRHPTSFVLVYEHLTGEMLGDDEGSWRYHVIGDVHAGRYRYLAVGGPQSRHLQRDGGAG